MFHLLFSFFLCCFIFKLLPIIFCGLIHLSLLLFPSQPNCLIGGFDVDCDHSKLQVSWLCLHVTSMTNFAPGADLSSEKNCGLPIEIYRPHIKKNMDVFRLDFFLSFFKFSHIHCGLFYGLITFSVRSFFFFFLTLSKHAFLSSSLCSLSLLSSADSVMTA